MKGAVRVHSLTSAAVHAGREWLRLHTSPNEHIQEPLLSQSLGFQTSILVAKSDSGAMPSNITSLLRAYCLHIHCLRVSCRLFLHMLLFQLYISHFPRHFCHQRD